MSEFCIGCLKKDIPELTEKTAVVSKDSTLCEGCGQIKPIVIKIKNIDKLFPK